MFQGPPEGTAVASRGRKAMPLHELSVRNRCTVLQGQLVQFLRFGRQQHLFRSQWPHGLSGILRMGIRRPFWLGILLSSGARSE